MRLLLYGVFAFFAAWILYIVGALAYATATDWQPSGVQPVTTYRATGAPDTLGDGVLRFVTWNVGYGGLGAKADFFLDAGHFYLSGDRMVRSDEADVVSYIAGIRSQVASVQADFVLLQEVDSLAKRSYHRGLLDTLVAARPTDFAAFAPNYKNDRVAVPVLTPWNVMGDVYAGLLSMSRYEPAAVERHALPGEFGWPDRVFQLDRCVLVQRHPLTSGRMLTVVNVHLSAYDKGGGVKAQQLAYLAEFCLAEEAAGNLVVVGGDWNLTPPNFPYDRFIGDPEGLYPHQAVPDGYPGEGWTFAYDAALPSNRKAREPYIRDSSFVTVIDYFLVSPGLRINRVRGINQDFQFSDHQPVYVEVEVL